MRALARIAVENMLFFCLCEDEEMDPDSALKMMENTNHYLGKCSEEERQAVLEVIAEMRLSAVERGDRASIEALDLIPEDAWPEEEAEEANGA